MGVWRRPAIGRVATATAVDKCSRAERRSDSGDRLGGGQRTFWRQSRQAMTRTRRSEKQKSRRRRRPDMEYSQCEIGLPMMGSSASYSSSSCDLYAGDTLTWGGEGKGGTRGSG